MVSQPNESLKITCQFIKDHGELCKRKIAPGESKCWQHARSWRRKWKSLTGSQTIAFLGLLAGLFIIGGPSLYFSYASWRDKTPPVSPPIAAEKPQEGPKPPTSTAAGNQNVTGNTVTQDSGSISQIGGSGNSAAITNNFGPQLRFPEQRLDRLATLLRTQRGTVSISVENADANTLQDATNLLAAFAKAKWITQGVNTSIHGTDIGADGLPVPIRNGIHIYSRAEQSALAEFVGKALKREFGIESHKEIDQNLADFDVALFVGIAYEKKPKTERKKQTPQVPAPGPTVTAPNENVTGNAITQGPGSIAQVGGIGNTAIIAAPSDWTMTPDQQNALINAFSRLTGRIKIIPLLGDLGAQTFADELRGAFHKANWTIDMGSFAFVCNPKFSPGWDCYGLDIQVHSRNSKQASAIIAALSSLHPHVVVQQEFDDDFVQIGVGKYRP
jgi:hypothetical protein